ncbi:MAG: T9SS type A sorting domain-containing protein [Bacteroidota bacterium]
MKRTLLIIYLFTILIGVKGQNYIPFPMDSTIWSVNSTKYFVHGDTTIGSNHYSKVWMQTDSVEFTFDMDKATYYAAIRNDTANQKIYGVYNKADSIYDYIWESTGLEPLRYNCDTCELLLYNFDVRNSTDTFFVYSFPFISSDGFNNRTDPTFLRFNHIIEYKITGLQMSSDTIIGIIRKVVQPEKNECYGLSEYWIEGIGGTAGLFSFGNYCMLYSGEVELLCVTEKEQLLYKRDSICYRRLIKYLGSVNEFAKSNDFTLYPNPVMNDDFWIRSNLPYDFEKVTIELFDIYGKKVLKSTVDINQTPISTANLAKGYYLYKITNKLNQKGYGKIIKL